MLSRGKGKKRHEAGQADHFDRGAAPRRREKKKKNGLLSDDDAGDAGWGKERKHDRDLRRKILRRLGLISAALGGGGGEKGGKGRRTRQIEMAFI